MNLSTEAESKVSHDGNVVNMLKRHGQLSLQSPKKKKEKKLTLEEVLFVRIKSLYDSTINDGLYVNISCKD